MNVLSLNAGSNTLRHKLFDLQSGGESADGERILTEGMVDRVKGPDVVRAAEEVVDESRSYGLDAIAYRVVHGGGRFDSPQRVTPTLIRGLSDLVALAPLHMPTDLSIIDTASRAAPDVPGVAVFDTTFHRTLPEVAWRYAVPDKLGPGLRRFGFHGIAHQYVTGELLRAMKRLPAGTRVVSLHLGGGSSACAVRDGRSVDTSMGLTPLEGLVMSTRCGDVDPGLLLHLFRTGRTADEVEDLLYREGGLLGLSGRSGDIRHLEPAAAAGDARSETALNVFAYRARKYIGAYAAALGGLDAVVLSGALAEHSAGVRARVLGGLEFLGIRLDAERNRSAGPNAPARVHADDSAVAAWMIPTDEERQMAREAASVLARDG